jgi:hypothetical protein
MHPPQPADTSKPPSPWNLSRNSLRNHCRSLACWLRGRAIPCGTPTRRGFLSRPFHKVTRGTTLFVYNPIPCGLFSRAPRRSSILQASPVMRSLRSSLVMGPGDTPAHRAGLGLGCSSQARLCSREELEAHVEANEGIQSTPATLSSIAFAALSFRAVHYSVSYATLLPRLHCCPEYRSLLLEVLPYFAQGKKLEL